LLNCFLQQVVLVGLMDRKFHGYLANGFKRRNEDDYLAIPKTTAEQAAELVVQADELLKACREFLKADTER